MLRSHLYLYPPPDRLPHAELFWLSTGLVTLFTAAFSAFFIVYLTTLQAAYLTNAEDLGIMDQAIWSTLHGHFLHQTICNAVSDTNCHSYSGITRFAIHFEPILIPVSLLYLIWPDPRMLQIVQTLVVASGAFPAFWLARSRLRNELGGVAIAVLYLLYPAQQWALVDDFHAVTFTAALLFYTLYFMYTRRTAWLFTFAILSMACKEEIPLVVAMFGLWSIIFQRRWRSGMALLLLAGVWAAVAFFIILHIYSPTGHPLLASRYTYLGGDRGDLVHVALNLLLHPLTTIKQHVFEPSHAYYLHTLWAPVFRLPLLAPHVLVLALPTLAVNLLSSDSNMYSGLFQYNAELVPILVFATIEAMVLILWLARWMLLAGLLVLIMLNLVRADYSSSPMPFARGFSWPVVTKHAQRAQHFIEMIPSDASVSAQSALVPHISHRSNIYLFPFADDRAEYIFLDITGTVYPFKGYDYVTEMKKVLLDERYGIRAAQDGYLLLKRGLTPPGSSSDYSLIRMAERIVRQRMSLQ